jgi:hypothetical protein
MGKMRGDFGEDLELHLQGDITSLYMLSPTSADTTYTLLYFL